MSVAIKPHSLQRHRSMLHSTPIATLFRHQSSVHNITCTPPVRRRRLLPNAAIATHPYDFFVRKDDPSHHEEPACVVDEGTAVAGGCWGSPSEVRRRLWTEDPSLNQELISSGTTISQLFTPEKWVIHRSRSRYILHLTTITTSTVFRRVLPTCLVLTAVAAILGMYNTAAAAVASGVTLEWVAVLGGMGGGWLEKALAAGPVGLPVVAHTLLGAAVSLQLVFRTNVSYSRFHEARTHWGILIHAARDWARIAATHMPYNYSCKAAAYVQAFAYCLKHQVRRPAKEAIRKVSTNARSNGVSQNGVPLDEGSMVLQQLLPRDEALAVLNSPHRCFHLLAKMTALLNSAHTAKPLPHYAAMRMDESLSKMAQVIGSCERIFGTPIPLSFTRHTTRCLTLWLATLPLALWPIMQWITLPALFVMCFIFLGIDEIGTEIEEPFCILPLAPLCKNIVRDVCSAMEMAAQT